MSRTRTFVMATPIMVLMLGGGIQLGRPLPPVQVEVPQAPLKLPGALSVSFPTKGQAALGEVSLGVAAETPNQEPVAIASLAKMMTAYLLLQAQPLKVGEDGPVTTVTAADVEEYQKARAAGHSVVKVSVGEKLTERQLLEALMLPSGGNIATMIANQVAGNEANFVKKMNQAAQALGMTQTNYADAAGANPATVSTAHDQLLMAQAAMQNRVFRDTVSMPQAQLPTAGTVYNVNFMVGKQGISGVKTGSTLAAGSCFVGSYPLTVEGKPRILLAAVLGQQSLHEAITLDAALLHAMAPQFKNYPLPVPREGWARITTPWHEQSGLTLSKPLQVFGYPGMTVNLEAKLTQTKPPIPAGQSVATLTLITGNTSENVGLQSTRAIQDPSPLWKLFH